MKHTGNHLEAVLDPMIDLLEENLMTVEGGFQFLLVLLLLDRHPKDVGRAL
jgi:hypothetical protein